MNVVQAIETSGPGGAERVMTTLAVALRERDQLAGVVLMKEGWLADSLRRLGVCPSVIPLRRALDRGFLDRLVSHLREVGADVIHSHEFGFALYGALAARRLGIVHVATAHGKNFAAGAKRRLAAAVLFRACRDSRLVAVSEDLAAALASALWLPPGRVARVLNGVAPPAAVASARCEGEPLRLLAIGNLYPVKNHGLLVRAVAGLRDRGVLARLDVLGRGAEREALERLARELGTEDRVTFHGFREDVGEFVGRSHVLVSASLSEGMPMSFLEAMAAGLPVVATRVGGVPELVADGQHGLLVPSGDLDALVAALEHLAADETRRRGLGAAAAGLVRERYSDERMVEAYQRLYAGPER